MSVAKICSVEGCGRKHQAKQYCVSHYQRFLRTGNPLPQLKHPATCTLAGCSRKYESRGLCGSHCAALRRKEKRQANVYKPEYVTWASMKRRCYGVSAANYARYGGRGIKVCDRWRESFLNFYQDMGDRPSPKHTLERINNDKNYEPNNCRWATSKEQANNRRSSRILVLNGKSQSLRLWAEEYQISYDLVLGRLKANWSLEKALTKPARFKKKNLTT